MALHVKRVGSCPRVVRDGAQPADAVGAGIVCVKDGLIGIHDLGDAVDRVVRVGRLDGARIELGL